MSHRKQYVIQSGCSSEVDTFSTGVPQGSILGPFLFLCYINVLPVFLLATCCLYVGDTTIFLPSKNLIALFSKASSVLEKFNLWLSYNKLAAKFHRTSCIFFRPSLKSPNSGRISFLVSFCRTTNPSTVTLTMYGVKSPGDFMLRASPGT